MIRGDLVSGGGFNNLLPGGGYAVNLPGTGANGAIGFHLANMTNSFQLDLALSALENENKGRVLSAPKITTQSNISATIQSGTSIPVQTIANNTITTTYINANLQLNVTPQVTAENTIVLKVVVESSSPSAPGRSFRRRPSMSAGRRRPSSCPTAGPRSSAAFSTSTRRTGRTASLT